MDGTRWRTPHHKDHHPKTTYACMSVCMRCAPNRCEVLKIPLWTLAGFVRSSTINGQIAPSHLSTNHLSQRQSQSREHQFRHSRSVERRIEVFFFPNSYTIWEWCVQKFCEEMSVVFGGLALASTISEWSWPLIHQSTLRNWPPLTAGEGLMIEPWTRL